MAEVHTAGDVIERIVDRARLPGRAARESLRRELEAHFEDAAARPGDLPIALAGFGDERAVVEAFRRVYREDYVVWYAARLALCVALATAAGLALLALTHLRFEAGGIVLAAGFVRRAANLFKLALGAAIAWELTRGKLTLPRLAIALGTYTLAAGAAQFFFRGGLQSWHFWTVPIMVGIGAAGWRLKRRLLAVSLTFGGFALTVYVFKSMRELSLLTSPSPIPNRTLLFAVECIVTWLVAAALLARSDQRLARVFNLSAEPGTGP